jgi:iron complex transport system ATP-binding protein
VRSLSFSHGAQRALDSLDLDFLPGRHYVLAGPNGAGKSTLLDLLARLRKPLCGSVELLGRDVAGYGAGEYARLVSLAPQGFSFNFPFTVREMVALGRRPYLGRWGRMGARDREAVDSALGSLNLLGLADKPVTRLSGGEARRVLVARTLAQGTPVVLLDEPTANLDVAQAMDLMGRVRGLADAGTLVVTVTHDLRLAAAYADHIAFLKGGSLVAAGPLGETLTAPVLGRVFDAEAEVAPDCFAGGLRLSFRPAKGGGDGTPGP